MRNTLTILLSTAAATIFSIGATAQIHSIGAPAQIHADSAGPSRFDSLKLFLQPVEVRALRAGEKAPFTKTDIDRKQIEQTNVGQDLPFL
ncbi:MAG TPA: hypothetical protein VG605_06345, partial [Puia sp.]|nr:hypothetical protein [Puia sp.]